MAIEDAKVRSLFTRGQTQVELVTIPKGVYIPPHCHPNIDSWLIFLDGRPVITKWKQGLLAKTTWAELMVPYHLEPDDFHTFETLTYSFKFINIQVWKAGVNPTSAQQDYILWTSLKA